MITLYINLDSAESRREWMERQFKARVIDAERVRAVTIDDLSSKTAGITFGNRMGRDWVDGEKACFLSHRECWRRIADGEDAFGAVFEDDVHLSADAAAFLTDESWIPPGADVVKIETYMTRVWLDKRCIVANGRSLHRLRSTHIGGAGYILSREAAARLFECSTHVAMPLDHLVFDPVYNYRLRVWQLNEAICIQDDLLNSKDALFTSQISESDVRAVNRKAKPKSKGKKIVRELNRIYKQVVDLASNPAWPITMRRSIISYRE
ncbi:glycosyl transferase [Thioclava dalianensis]|uniref:Glycosyl transferase n=1 Tax=Thioclava dalianensis TaxID=1185766 RepID=A0A074T835_9RHOB|nr:glycosyltransferase family 25 protein [Thioclava dalianensis]KEP67864.1 glycosyl transferase [Thioclava dalianensis]